MPKPKLILYISMSLDGYIATKNDDISWLSIVEKEGEDYGYAKFTETIDTYIVGRKTYDTVLKLTGGIFPQAKKYKCYVITRKERQPENGVTFYNGKIEDLVSELKNKNGKNIYCDGGAEIVKLLVEQNLIDEYIVSIIPILLGEGKKLFLEGKKQTQLTTKSVKQFESGLVQLHYENK